MNYKIGDTVIHWTHGLGTVIGIEDMQLTGLMRRYYVIKVKNSKLWVPVEEDGGCSIRYPTDSNQFEKFIEILRTPGQQLSDQHYQRKLELHERMRKMTLEGLCHVIRDLTDRSHQHTLNIDDVSVLDRAREHLLDEWLFSFQADRQDILLELEALLHLNGSLSLENQAT